VRTALALLVGHDDPKAVLVAACTTPMWRAWQLSVPATGLTHSDQRHPGSNAKRPTVAVPIRTNVDLGPVGGPRLVRRLEVARFRSHHGSLLSAIDTSILSATGVDARRGTGTPGSWPAV
jgi:hypothetical protein